MLYEVTWRGTYFNQEIVNRWNYLSGTIPPGILGSLGLLTALGGADSPPVFLSGSMFWTIMGGLSVDFSVQSVEVRAASDYDPLDFFEVGYNPSMVGQNGNAGQSPTQAFGFRTNRVRLDIARGTKRFPGAPEGAVDPGGVIAASYLPFLTDMATEMSEVKTFTATEGSVEYTPVVVSKKEYTTPSGRKAYRYYPTLAEQLDHIAIGVTWSPYETIRTQTSRQYGRGA